MKKPSFVHLHTHTHYSLLDGLSKVQALVSLAKKDGMPALAVTDHGNLYGAIEFYMECKKAEIKPIIGVEAYITPGDRKSKEPGIDIIRYHLTLLAKNNVGYQNLIKLVTISHLEGYYYKPRMDKALLREHSEGIIALSGCFGGELAKAIRAHDMDLAAKVIAEHQEIFGKENYFLEVQSSHDIPGHNEFEKAVIELSKKHGVPLVATQDSHYPTHEDKHAHETLLAIQTNTDLTDDNRFSLAEADLSFIDTETALKKFKHIPEAIENTVKIADMCDVSLELGHFLFPDFPLPPGITPTEKLRELAYAGLKVRGLEKDAAAKERLEYELGIIKFKGYEPYFLVVEDLIRFAHDHDIYTNIRGSVAGSMTTYVLGITKLNPLEYNIPFERFLNPDRPSAPDIDMDFADNRREEVLEYTKKQYGEDKVAQIGTFGTMMARGAVRDVARALGYEYAVGDRISKLIPMGSQGFPMTIDHAMELEPELSKMYKDDKSAKEILDIAKRLEGCVRHISVHAAGVVIAPKPLIEYTPVQFDPKGGKIITQYDMYTVGEDGVGLTKFDFLGIKNLTILANAVRRVEKLRGEKIDIEQIPLDDKLTFEMLARGETVGLFQLNGDGMTKWLVELKPTSIHDINAMVALYRPGPMQFIPDYIARKHNPKLISYLDPALEDILKQTYGILVYQDDLLIMANKLAGYSWGEVDKFRKAVGKKIPEEMAKQKEKFIEGCVEHSKWARKKAEEIWAWIEPFAAYGFNKAHSASYGRVAYQTAYMKANYPAEYMAAVLTADSGDVEKIAEIIRECKHMKIPVLPPDINESYEDFAVIKGKKPEEDKIRFGLFTIKNLGSDISHAIIEERKENGKFTSFANFLERVTHRNLNKKSLEALIKSGTLDEFGERGNLLANMEEALAYNREFAQGPKDQTSLFGDIAEHADTSTLVLKNTPHASAAERLAWEKELLGLYVSGHPLDQYNVPTEIKNTLKLREGMIAVVSGIIDDVRVVNTKNGTRMAFVRLADYNEEIEAVAFPKTYTEFRSLLEAKDRCIKIKGRISERNGEKSIVIDAVKELALKSP